MPVREFRDGKGREWRAWNVEPDDLNPRTKDEVYLSQLYYTGWIVFETKTGQEKRRLYPIPKAWHELADLELEVLLQKAEIVPPRKLRSERQSGAAAAKEVERAQALAHQLLDNPDEAGDTVSEETPDITDLRVMRTFRYPSGRIWDVEVSSNPQSGGPPVLRFTAGDRVIDLEEWPKDWVDYPDTELVRLLRRAAPRPITGPPADDTPRRRWDDRPAP